MSNSIYEHDINGNLIYFKSLISNREYWKEYDKNNRCIHCKYSDGTEWWKEYNENNDMIYYKNNKNIENRYKWEGDKRIRIYTKFNRFEIMDI